MDEESKRTMKFQQMVADAMCAVFESSDENPLQKIMEWPKHIEGIHSFVKVGHYEIRPKERTEKGFLEWIVDRPDIGIIKAQLTAWLTFCKSNNKDSRKDSAKATQLKEEGNHFFKKKNYPASVKSYTESARFSTIDNDHFSVAIANRSASFFHMCRYKESLQDIELAIKTNYPERLSWKLHLRAAQSHLKLRQGKLAEDSLAKLRKVVETCEEITAAMRETILKQAKGLSIAASESQKRYENFEPPSTAKAQPMPEDILKENSIFPFASSAVVRKRSPTRGRYVVAGQPIKKGDVLFAEKPFAWVPVTHGNNVSLCAHCCGPMDDALVPCKGCVTALYCNSTCWKNAWCYHQWECPGYHLAMWQQIGVSHLAFKMFLMSITTTDQVWFNDVQKLVTNIDKKSSDDVLGLTIASLMLTIYLETYTNFFDTVDLKECLVDKFNNSSESIDNDISTRKGKVLFVGSMILRHSLQMLANAYAVMRLVDVDPSVERETLVEEQQRIAAGAYPSASMLNHSCDPTVIHSFWNNWLIIKALKDVGKGEEIFICYGPYFKRMGKAQRQMDLQSHYCFGCHCSACTNPLFDNYTERFDGLKCPKCSGSTQRLLPFETQICFDCGASSKLTCTAALQEAAELCDKGMELTEIDKWEKAISCFDKSLAIREKHMYKHNEDLAITLDSLGKCYASTGHWLKSISYLERSLAAIEERYGSDSIEVANELNKVTDVCFQYLKRTLSRRSQEYRDTFIKTQKYVDRALAIISLTGPWNDRYQQLSDKREQLSGMLEQLRI